jgi:DedD protein
MAIFSTRSGKRDADEAPTKNVPIDSIETLRTRARQRLIGAVVLVALGIITFTVLFDSQPRPIPVDIQITMPDKDKPDATVTTVVPAAVVVSAAPTAPAPVVETPATAVTQAAVQASASLSAKEEIVAPKTDKKLDLKVEAKQEVKVEPKVEAKPVVKPESKQEAKQEAKQETKAEVKPTPTPKPVAKPAAIDEAAKALAILEGKEPPKTASTATAAATTRVDAAVGRFIVQVGAFAENEKAREVRLRVERAGLKTYVHVAETTQGKRIRVRVGPFTTRAEADKAAAKIKTLDLPAAILTL